MSSMDPRLSLDAVTVPDEPEGQAHVILRTDFLAPVASHDGPAWVEAHDTDELPIDRENVDRARSVLGGKARLRAVGPSLLLVVDDTAIQMYAKPGRRGSWRTLPNDPASASQEPQA